MERVDESLNDIVLDSIEDYNDMIVKITADIRKAKNSFDIQDKLIYKMIGVMMGRKRLLMLSELYMITGIRINSIIYVPYGKSSIRKCVVRRIDVYDWKKTGLVLYQILKNNKQGTQLKYADAYDSGIIVTEDVFADYNPNY